MKRTLATALATTAIAATLGGLTAAPATASPLAPAQTVADSGSASGSAQLLKAPLSFAYILLCGMWASPSPNPNPLCNTLSSGSAN